MHIHPTCKPYSIKMHTLFVVHNHSKCIFIQSVCNMHIQYVISNVQWTNHSTITFSFFFTWQHMLRCSKLLKKILDYRWHDKMIHKDDTWLALSWPTHIIHPARPIMLGQHSPLQTHSHLFSLQNIRDTRYYNLSTVTNLCKLFG